MLIYKGFDEFESLVQSAETRDLGAGDVVRRGGRVLGSAAPYRYTARRRDGVGEALIFQCSSGLGVQPGEASRGIRGASVVLDSDG